MKRRFPPLLLALGLLAPSLWSPLKAEAHTPSIDLLKQTSRGFSHIAAKAIPAVVSIRVEGEYSNGPTPWSGQLPFQDEFFRRFFGIPLVPDQRQPFAGFGSGVLLREDGYIVTNYHVIREANLIEVTLADDTRHKATLVGSDPDTDLAVIKIEGKGFPWLCLGDSDNLQVGEWVIAIGAPQALRSTVTVGVVSAKGRSDLEFHTIEEFIQSDVAINKGNSGGPMLNVDGEIVGINSAILSNDGTYMGISLAIPSSIVRTVSEQIINHGGVRRGFMGVYLKPVTEEIAAAYNLEKAQGVVITDVIKGSPAEKAGLRFGDVILAVAGQPVRDVKGLHRMLWLNEPGKVVRLSLNREGQLIEVDVKLDSKSVTVAQGQESFGIELSASSDEEKNGFVISSVRPSSPAAKAGIQPGMRLLGINRKRPETLKEAGELLKNSYQKGKVLLLVDTGRGSAFILLQTH